MDIAIIVAGDEDYVDLVQDIKQYGVRLTGSFFERATSPALRLAVDYFHPLWVWGTGHKKLVKRIKS